MKIKKFEVDSFLLHWQNSFNFTSYFNLDIKSVRLESVHDV